MKAADLAQVRKECETYLQQAQQRKRALEASSKPTAKTPGKPVKAAQKSDDDIPDPVALEPWLIDWRRATLDSVPYIRDIFLAEQVRDALKNDTLDRFYAEELTEKIAADIQSGGRTGDDTQQETLV